MLNRGPKTFALMLATTALLALSACDSAEERAEGHYQSAIELMDGGDVDRALVELRNVFDLKPEHHAARALYADTLMENGQVSEAFQQYLILSEFKPDHLQARLRLAEIAVSSNNWELAERHGRAALELAPDNAEAQMVAAVLDYRTAIEEEDSSAQANAVDRIREVRTSLEESLASSQILVDNYLREGDLASALAEVERVISENPQNEQFQVLKLRLLGGLDDRDGVREQLETLVELFPETPAYGADLIRWFVMEGNPEAAEAYIRERIAGAEGDAVTGERVLLVNFLRRTRGIDAALAEVEKLADENPEDSVFKALKAGLQFDSGDREAAIASLEALVSEVGETEAGLGYKVALAQMLQTVGNQVAARQRVEEVLALDERNVEATKMLVVWLISEDKADEAISRLRVALQDAPEDPQIMALLADAHLRNGNRDLAREMLALASQTSGGAPEYAVRYGRFLLADENLAPAEDVLLDSLRATPDQPQVLALLGEIYVRQQDWARAEQVEATLRRLETEAADGIANSIQIARLRGQQRGDEAFQLLEELAAQDQQVGRAELAILQEHVAQGNLETAEAYVDELGSKHGEVTTVKMLRAGVLRAAGRPDEAEAIYRDLLVERPEAETIWRALFGLKMSQGEADGAREVLEEGLAAVPQAPNLQWALAGFRERDGDIDGAIEIYEELYAALPNSPIVANNLASLIATYREDEAELERAFTIARRLRGAEIPAFQDTYGWISYRRGQYDEALQHLEPAAAGLQSDPIVQYHYGMALAASGRTEEAIAQLQAAIDLAGPADSRPQFDRAKEEIERLQQAAQEASGN